MMYVKRAILITWGESRVVNSFSLLQVSKYETRVETFLPQPIISSEKNDDGIGDE